MKSIIIIFSILLFSSSAWAISVGSTDVGIKDELISQTRLANSGDDLELNWVRTVLKDSTITLESKYDTLANNWQLTDEANVYALALQDKPDFFLIKTGGKGNTDFLFNNKDSLSWAVIALSDVNITSIQGVSRISHVDEFNGAPVPEPGTILLLGGGILGLGLYGKRRMKS